MKLFKYLISLSIITTSFAYAGQPESYYQDKWCEGQTEVVLEDRTRVDCLTDTYAIEVDFARKWAEAIGQSLYYASMTNKKPAVLLIVEPGDSRFVARFHNAAEGLGIRVYLIDVE